VSRRARVAATVMGAVGFGFCMAGIAGVVLSRENPGESPVTHQVLFELGFTLVFGMLGGFLVRKRPGNGLGWILLAQGLGAAVLFAANRLPATIPGGVWLALLSLLGLFTALGLVPLALLLFPDGRLPSRRWRPVAWAGAAGAGAAGITEVLVPFEQSGVGGPYENPLALQAYAGFLEAAFFVAALLMLLALVGGAASLVVRFRRTRGIERQQVKWVAFAALWGVAVYLTGGLTTRLPVISWDLVMALALFPFPLAIAVAVTRHRLYEIDRIISRTVSYGLLTGGLVGLYAAGVFVLTPLVAGLGGGSELAVAASTLAVAAAFGPVRRRVQAVVDRRFNRARYDAQRTVGVFRDRLRSEVDLDHLQRELVAVVDGAVAPERVSLWLRQQQPARRGAQT
jgi:hypothetical protein